MKKGIFAVLALALAAVLGLAVACGGTVENRPGGETFTVTFETVGGSSIEPVEVERGEPVLRPDDPTKAGSTFIDWFTDAAYTGDPYDFSLPVNGDLTLYAQWSDTDYAIVFDVNGGSPVIDYATYSYGETVAEPAPPARVGYTFAGWYTDVACTNEASFPYTVTGNTQFYAGWTSTRDVTVRFRMCELRGDDRDINYDQPILDPVTIKAGEKLEQPANPKDITYLDGDGTLHTLKFSYWNFDPVYGIYSDAVLFPVTKTDVEEITLYAVYTEVEAGDTYASLTVHPNNGEAETVMYGVQGEALAIVNLDEHDPQPFYSDRAEPRNPGYTVSGYFKLPDFTSGSVYEIPFVFEDESNDVYIRWEKQEDLTVTFDWSFASMEDTTEPVAYSGLIERPENKIVAGYTFDGWYSTLYSAVEEQRWDFALDMAYTDITLKAKWVKTATVITYDTRGGYARNPVSVSAGREITELPTPVRQTGDTAYNFLGWYLDSGCTQEAVLPMTIDEDITLYAKWSDAFDVSLFEFLALGGSGGYSVRVKPRERAAVTGEAIIPMRYAGEEVTRLETGAFANCVNVTEVTVPDTIDYLYGDVFSGCTALRKVTLPDGLRQISTDVFAGCENLAEVNFPDGGKLYSIYANIFADNPLMWEQLEQDDAGNYYWGTAFLGKTCNVTGEKAEDNETTSVTVRDGTTVAATWSFYYMYALEEVTFADSVRYLPGHVFSAEAKCVLKTVHLPASYENAGSLTTYFPSTLEEITLSAENENFAVTDGCLISLADKRLITSVVSADSIPDGVVIIGEDSFIFKELDTVVIPDTVTTIRESAFSYGTYTHIDIPDSVGILDSTAFENCTQMQSVTFGAKTNLQTEAFFDGMYKMRALSVSSLNPYMASQDNVLYDKATGEIIYFAAEYEGDLTLRDGLESIPAGFFEGAVLASLTVPDSVTSVEEGALYNLSAARLVLGKNVPEIGMAYTGIYYAGEVVLSAENPYMTVRDGVLYSKDKTRLLIFPNDRASYVFPDEVQVIDRGVWMPMLDSVTLGAGISRETLEMLAFDSGSESLFGTFGFAPDEVFVSGDNAELTEFCGVVYSKDKQDIVYIPANFDGDLVLPKEMKVLDELVAAHTSPVKMDAESYWDEPTTLHIRTLRAEEGSVLTAVAPYVFTTESHWYGFDESPEDRIPAWVQERWHDWGDVGVEVETVDLTAAEELTSVGSNAFAQNGALKKVALPSSLSYIGYAAFQFCEALEEVTGLANAEMEGSVFTGCGKLYDEDGLMIAEGILLSVDYSKYDVSKDLILPDTVRRIASGAMQFVFVRSLRIPATVEEIASGAIEAPGDMVIYVDGDGSGFAENWYTVNEYAGGEVTLIVGGVSENGVYFYADPATGLYYRLDPDGTAALVDDQTATEAWSGAASLPASVEYGGKNYELTEIGESALNRSKSLTSLTLPDTLKTIGNNAFTGLSVAELIIPESVTELGHSLFYRNKTIERVRLPSGITEIPSFLFADCEALEEVVCGEIGSVGNSAFSGCTSLTSFAFASVRAVGESAFEESAVGTAEFSCVTSVGESAFRDSALTALVLPSACKTVGAFAFSGCAELRSVTLAEGLADVGEQAFADTGMQGTLTVPASLTECGDYAFSGNNALEKVVFAQDATAGGKGMFQQCAALTEVVFGGGAAYTVGTQAFWQCTALANVTLGEGLASVGAHAFRETALASISFPSALRTIGDYAFYKCLAPVQGAAEEIVGPSLRSVTFAEGLESIGEYAFYEAGLASVSLPASLRSVGAFAFGGNYTKQPDGEGGYTNVASLASVTFREGLESLGERAFTGAAVETLSMPASLTEYGDAVFFGCASLKTVVFADGSTKIGGKNAFQCKALERVEFGASEGLEIAAQTFYAASSLCEVVFDENCVVKSVGNYAFGSTGLKELTMPPVENMGVRVFYQCVGLVVTVPYAADALPAGWVSNWNTSADAQVVYGG